MRLRSLLSTWISQLGWPPSTTPTARTVTSASTPTPAARPSALAMEERAYDRIESMVARQRGFGVSLNPPPLKPMPRTDLPLSSVAVEDLGDLLSLAMPLMPKREPRLIRV